MTPPRPAPTKAGRCAIVGLAAMYIGNMWLLCGKEHKLTISADGNMVASAICGNCLWSINIGTDLESISIVAGSCANDCSCCEDFAIAFKMTEACFARIQQEVCCGSCCVSNPHAFSVNERNKLVTDFGFMDA